MNSHLSIVMEDIVKETISDAEVNHWAKEHNDAVSWGNSKQRKATLFQYAHALLRSAHSQDVKHGIRLFEDFYYKDNHEERRDYLYYIAIGQTRLVKYNLALECVKRFIKFEPNNQQAKLLQAYISKEKDKKDFSAAFAIFCGASLLYYGFKQLEL